ncbi:RidA family protein [Pseudomonas sp. JDS28PS106]|uniref:RidA family protein n=1 Tax=Pseudomonas sp. JDS28PS106 TaxID=2497235 RepID=UPI002FCF9564
MSRFDTAVPFDLINPAGLYDPSPNGYSHVAQVASGTRLLFMAGQGGEREDGSLPPLFADQLAQALINLRTGLRACNADLGQVFKLMLLIVDHSQEKLNAWVEAAEDAWGDAMKPACTLIPVPRLALEGMLIEIEAVAALREESAQPGL